MLTLTITLGATEHQIFLAFETQQSLDAAIDLLRGGSNPAPITVQDDFGRTATLRTPMITHIVTEDMQKHWKFRNKATVIRGEAELALNQELGQRPDLKFLVGGARAEFGRM